MEIDDTHRSPFVKSLGIEVLESREGYCVAALTTTETHTNSLGLIHGGVIFTLADRAFGMVTNREGDRFVTMDMQVRYLRPALPGQRLRAVAQRIHQGRQTAYVRIDVLDDDDRLIACLSGTGHRMGEKASHQ